MSAFAKNWGEPWEPRPERSVKAAGATPAPECGAGCQGGLYTVRAGDSMYTIAQRLGVSLDVLVACNPQVADPSRIEVGEQLCTPNGQAPNEPCCVVLGRVTPLPGSDAEGVALVRGLVGTSPGSTGVTFAAEGLPDPAELGDFDSYVGLVSAGAGSNFTVTLTPTAELPPTWSGSITDIAEALPAQTTLIVEPYNTSSGAYGNALLSGSLAHCGGGA